MPSQSTMSLKSWSRVVQERDHHTCQKCGTQTGRLVAHHIVPRKDNPSLTFELTNGKTLCYICHSVVHKICYDCLLDNPSITDVLSRYRPKQKSKE